MPTKVPVINKTFFTASLNESTEMKFLFIAFVIVPIAEISLLFKVGDFIGAFWTIGIILFTASLGATLLRRQGLKMLLQASTRLQQGQMPAQEVAEGFLIAISGAFLLTPGFITDTIGFSLLVPGIRQLLINKVLSSMKVNAQFTASSFEDAGSPFQTGSSPFDGSSSFNSRSPFNNEAPFKDSTVIDGQFEVSDEPGARSKNNQSPPLIDKNKESDRD